ncbi:uncharacterized protein LOC126599130 [Malus sylvestris]|uniref:uncharacterized protein LOC126599130 n=1 Tax=Malus sylvestris TaxID=3752 RepID=UPI0021AC1EEF|nr:uncharacterized protein LOC126599130 [Malus sylvestris]
MRKDPTVIKEYRPVAFHYKRWYCSSTSSFCFKRLRAKQESREREKKDVAAEREVALCHCCCHFSNGFAFICRGSTRKKGQPKKKGDPQVSGIIVPKHSQVRFDRVTNSLRQLMDTDDTCSWSRGVEGSKGLPSKGCCLHRRRRKKMKGFSLQRLVLFKCGCKCVSDKCTLQIKSLNPQMKD